MILPGPATVGQNQQQPNQIIANLRYSKMDTAPSIVCRWGEYIPVDKVRGSAALNEIARGLAVEALKKQRTSDANSPAGKGCFEEDLPNPSGWFSIEGPTLDRQDLDLFLKGKSPHFFLFGYTVINRDDGRNASHCFLTTGESYGPSTRSIVVCSVPIDLKA